MLHVTQSITTRSNKDTPLFSLMRKLKHYIITNWQCRSKGNISGGGGTRAPEAQNATRNAKYNDSIEQGHSFVLTNAEIEALYNNKLAVP